MTPNASTKARALARKLGATIEVRSGDGPYEVLIEAPRGHHWSPEMIHERVVSAWDGDTPADVWDRAVEDLRELVAEPCTDECEWWDSDPA